MLLPYLVAFFFFFNDTATTEIYTLSLHDALPIYSGNAGSDGALVEGASNASGSAGRLASEGRGDRKSTRLNSSHQIISYAVFCLKKKMRNRVTVGCIATTKKRPHVLDARRPAGIA